MQTILLIAGFGLMGTFCRYGVDKLVGISANGFPLSTLIINILGSLFAGLVYALGERQGFSAPLQTGLLVGFCGAFTTFSAYALQSAVLIESGKFSVVMLYVFLSPALGLAAALLPIILMRRLL